MLRKAQAAFLIAAIALLCSCELLDRGSFTFADSIATAYITVETVNNNTLARLEAGTIPPDDAERVLLITSEARALTDIALAAYEAGDQTRAASTLAIATGVLSALEERLAK